MAGHSKWANIKHRKSRQDEARGKIFTKIAREIMVAARHGGEDPDHNIRLRLALQKARTANMPNDNINRAISRGSGGSEGEDLEEIVYEGYGPGGVAMLLEILTDNRNRTAGEIRHMFSRHGGNMGESGCVNWMFQRKGLVLVESSGKDNQEDTVMLAALEAGAEDVRQVDQGWEIITSPEDLEEVRQQLADTGIEASLAEVTMIPDNLTSGPNQVLSLIEALEDHDDVQNVYTNWDMPSQ